MLKKLKQATLKSLKLAGALRLVHDSSWRRQQLLILAYHGISLNDEHLWDDTLYVPPNFFRRRLEQIKKSCCTVLPLGEAVARLYAGDLPDRSVALTFDDGTYDFYREAYPIIKEFDFPVTLYLTTFYSRYNRPVFDVICSYLLWKGRGGVALDLGRLIGREEKIELSSAAARASVLSELRGFARQSRLSAEEKDALAASLAAQLGVDYDALLARRMLHLLTPEEVKQVSAGGVDVQLHTHRHQTPLERELFLREIEDNRRCIREMTGFSATHFCYPSGVYHPSFFPWLEETGVVSATTCDPGLATRDSKRLLLPRLIDTCRLSPIEFEGWLTGVAAVLPHR
jgi:peptidoglycan/xylan/chitin deacetylase (PgdA/CDA1 family)